MTKHLFTKKLNTASLLVFVMLAGCTKVVDSKNTFTGAEQDQLLQSTNDITAIVSLLPNATFISQVNTTTRTDSSTMIFDFILRKSFKKEGSNRLSVPYGDPQFADRGWRYEITIDPATQEIILAPNDVMAAGIVRGSFQTISATFDKATLIFNFLTRFKELNGNRNEVGETLSKKL